MQLDLILMICFILDFLFQTSTSTGWVSGRWDSKNRLLMLLIAVAFGCPLGKRTIFQTILLQKCNPLENLNIGIMNFRIGFDCSCQKLGIPEWPERDWHNTLSSAVKMCEDESLWRKHEHGYAVRHRQIRIVLSRQKSLDNATPKGHSPNMLKYLGKISPNR